MEDPALDPRFYDFLTDAAAPAEPDPRPPDALIPPEPSAPSHTAPPGPPTSLPQPGATNAAPVALQQPSPRPITTRPTAPARTATEAPSPGAAPASQSAQGRQTRPGRSPAWLGNWLARFQLRDPEEPIDPRRLAAAALTSLLVHLLLLGLLAFFVIRLRSTDNVQFVSDLAGSPYGDELGNSPLGGLGIDTPLELAEPTPPGAESQSNLLELPPIAALTPSDSRASTPRATNPDPNLSGAGGPQAGAGDGFGVARFGRGTETIQGVRVKVGNPQFTLIWDSDVDLDLHVIEPGGSEIYWEERQGEQGGELDVDDVDGRGPENVNYDEGRGAGPPGTYRWFVHYFGGFAGRNQPTRWKVRVKHDGKVSIYEGRFTVIGQKSREYALEVGAAAHAAPMTSGPAAQLGFALAPPGASFEMLLPREPDPAEVPEVLASYEFTEARQLQTGPQSRILIAWGNPSNRPIGSLAVFCRNLAREFVPADKGNTPSTRPVAIGNRTGAEVLYQKAGDIRARVQVYYLGDTLVLIRAEGPGNFIQGDSVRAVLDSLRERAVAPDADPLPDPNADPNADPGGPPQRRRGTDSPAPAPAARSAGPRRQP
jgi:hypothetical protein